jgi:asparagine synthase (glutamine-hydrolysing)
MCGLAGILGFGGAGAEAVEDIAWAMGQAVQHRGPDGSGLWIDSAAEVALVHRRLSIIDLSPSGDQPMRSASGRYIIVFNGEIYNHRTLRAALEGAGQAPRWRGRSDTETLLAAIEAWGLAVALQRSHGMFALALWDRHSRRLSLARDRMGEKPLYYGWQGHSFLFGSELKALRCHPAFTGETDREAVAAFLQRGYVPAPRSIHAGIAKLAPGCIVTVSPDRDASLRPYPYWSLVEAIVAGRADPIDDPLEAVDELDRLLGKAVVRQMEADVPLGAFLSGGIDSSTIVALMQAHSSRPVKTFTIGYDDRRYDEAGHAQAVARHLGTDHHGLVATPANAEAVIPRLPQIYDEPFADISQIPTALIAALTRRHVTVALSGDGGDELFAGYNRYGGGELWARLQRLPFAVRRTLSATVFGMGAERWNALGAPLRLAGVGLKLGDKLFKGMSLANAPSLSAFHLYSMGRWQDAAVLMPDIYGAADGAGDPAISCLPGVEQMLVQDSIDYLPDDILVKVDRAAMAASLETRAPLLDHKVVELAWRLPLELKRREGKGKWPLRRLLDRYVPRSLTERPKMGFRVPLESWLRGPLRDWAEDLLDERRIAQKGYFDPAPIRCTWHEHLAGTHNWKLPLWTVLMFQAWLADAGDRPTHRGASGVRVTRGPASEDGQPGVRMTSRHQG